MFDIPKTLFLTWCTPDSRYAGGEAIRRLLSKLPADRIKWCGLNGWLSGPDPRLPEYRAFVPRGLHWRLEGSALHHYFANDLQARRLAADMWKWAEAFNPDVLWVVPELAAVQVARHLHRLSGLAVHATVHDAPESARQAGVPRAYVHHYQRCLRDLMRDVSSMDCVGPELIEHMQARFDSAHCQSGVVRPTVDPSCLKAVRPREWGGRTTRRIGLCGSFRIDDNQWAAFLRQLGHMPITFEFISFTPPDAVPSAIYPKNVSLHFKPYVSRDVELVDAFDRAGVDACYLGVWNAESRALFGRTSLSSKLTTYSASAVPVIFHGRQDAAACHMIHHYGAGLRFNENEADTCEALHALFLDEAKWNDYAAGARTLCDQEFLLDANVEKLAGLLSLAAAAPKGARR